MIFLFFGSSLAHLEPKLELFEVLEFGSWCHWRWWCSSHVYLPKYPKQGSIDFQGEEWTVKCPNGQWPLLNKMNGTFKWLCSVHVSWCLPSVSTGLNSWRLPSVNGWQTAAATWTAVWWGGATTLANMAIMNGALDPISVGSKNRCVYIHV